MQKSVRNLCEKKKKEPSLCGCNSKSSQTGIQGRDWASAPMKARGPWAAHRLSTVYSGSDIRESIHIY